MLEEQLKMQQSVARIDHKEMEGIQEAMLLQLDGIWVATRSSALAGGYRTGLGSALVSDYA